MYDYQKIFESANLQGISGRACNCVGPQNGQAVCPCAMRSVKVVNGRYVRTEDLGPVPGHADSDGGEPD